MVVVGMTCYFRHLGPVFEKAGITVTKENRRELNQTIQGMVGGNADCPAVWRQIKSRLAEDEDCFAAELKAAWEKRKTIRG